MHVLPLPFGLALALMPRRDVERFRPREEIRPPIRNAISPRDRILSDLRNFNTHA